jgi:uncharacterized protein (DUF39 family)
MCQVMGGSTGILNADDAACVLQMLQLALQRTPAVCGQAAVCYGAQTSQSSRGWLRR